LAERLAGDAVAALYASPLARARQTADVVAQRLGLAVIDRDGLKEHDVGVLSGLTGAEVRERYPEFVRARSEGRRDIALEGLEPWAAFRVRADAALDEISAAHPEQTVAVVTHGGVIRVFLRRALDLTHERSLPLAISNAGVTTFDVRDGKGEAPSPPARLVGLNDTCHLNGL